MDLDSPSSPSAPDARSLGALALVFTLVALAVYAPALSGKFVSDDIGYVSGNPYVHAVTLENVLAIADPFGAPAAHTANYAPVHLMLHMVNWRLFGAVTTGHHVVNVVLHALVSVLLVLLFQRRGAPFAAAAFAGAIFLLHPANVEAVAWIFQLKTVVSLGLAVGALLVERRHPLLGVTFFALALLAKITAAFALPVLAAQLWVETRHLLETGDPRASRSDVARRARWLAAWALVLGLALVPEMLAFERLGHAGGTGADLGSLVRGMLAITGRYGVMALTSVGLSAFHQPEAPTSWLDPLVLLGLALAGLVAVRGILCLWRRNPEAVWWVWVVGGFLPVSQLLPFLYPMGDRYLYVVLPGLLGVALTLATPALWRLGARGRVPLAVVGVACTALLVGASVRSVERARIWKSDLTLSIDSAAHYPAAIPASLLRAHDAARRGDAAAAAAAIRAAVARGYDRFMDLQASPVYASVRQAPEFSAAIAEVAGVWIERVEVRADPTPMELRMLGHAHAARGEWDLATARLEAALAAGGPESRQLRADLAELRVERIRAERALRRAEEEARGEPPP